MKWSTLFRLWWLPLSVLAELIALLAVLVFGEREIILPGADGLRYVRQFSTAFLPVLLGSSLIDPTPEITTTLSRADRLMRWLRIWVFVGTL